MRQNFEEASLYKILEDTKEGRESWKNSLVIYQNVQKQSSKKKIRSSQAHDLLARTHEYIDISQKNIDIKTQTDEIQKTIRDTVEEKNWNESLEIHQALQKQVESIKGFSGKNTEKISDQQRQTVQEILGDISKNIDLSTQALEKKRGRKKNIFSRKTCRRKSSI